MVSIMEKLTRRELTAGALALGLGLGIRPTQAQSTPDSALPPDSDKLLSDARAQLKAISAARRQIKLADGSEPVTTFTPERS